VCIVVAVIVMNIEDEKIVKANYLMVSLLAEMLAIPKW